MNDQEKIKQLETLITSILQFSITLSDDPIDRSILDDFEDELNSLV